MDHIAFLKKSWKLKDKILVGEKTIESRWYMSKIAPWNKIHVGETIYFKDSGEPVTVRASVAKFLQFELTQKKVLEILKQYGREITISDIQKTYENNKDKKYCILIFLKDVKKIEPFYINKKGFGISCAWITVDDVKRIKRQY